MILARIVGILLLLLPTLATAEGDADLCNAAAVSAAQNAAMPADVLLALTLVETGRTIRGNFQPWPWTINMKGKGHWFATRSEAVDFATHKYISGARSFDIGCFQINHRWHGQAFTSFDQMFDPQANATYAAKLMTSLFAEGGSWSWAAGAYHSRTGPLSAKYRARFDRIIANLPYAEIPLVIAALEPQKCSACPHTQPLDIAKLTASKGSLAAWFLVRSNSPLLATPTGALF